MQYRAQAAGMYRLLYRAFPPVYNPDRLWTERNTTYALMGCLSQYWITGDVEALTRAEAYFEMILEMSEITGAPLHPYNQHEDSGPSTPVSSPWMTGMLVEAFVQLYRTNGDERIVAWIARFCDWVVATGFYVNYEVPEFIGHRIPCYLVGATQQFPDLGGASADAEHCYDVAILLQKGAWAKQRLGQDSTQMQSVVYEQLFVADSASASTARVLCYSVVGGVPTSLLWATAITTVPAVGGLVEFPIPVTGIENTDAAGTYALMMVTSDWPQRLGSATGQAGYTTFISYGSVSIASPPATWPTSDTTYADVAMAVWCEY